MEQTSIFGHSGDRAIFSKVNNLVLCFVVISILGNLATHTYDNKFTHNGEVRPVFGAFYLAEEDLEKKYYYLDQDWELYRGLVDGKTEKNPITYVDAGQYAGFELEDRNGNPYGSVTYRMRLLLPKDEGRYMLELPEIFSAYRIFINGEQVLQSGNPDSKNYVPRIIQSKLTFSAAGETEILMQVSNFSHYYSGLVYPPAFGTEQQVGKLVAARTVIKSIQCFFAFLMFLYYLIIFFLNGKDKRKLYFSLICLGYLGYGSYFLIHTFVATTSFLWYRLENFCFMFLLFFLCELTCSMWGDYRRNAARALGRILGIFVMLGVLFLPQFMDGSLRLMIAYSFVIELYKLTVITYLVIRCGSMLGKNMENSKMLMFALLFFGVSLFFDTFHRNYEPILLGWGAEYAGFLLLCTLGTLVIKEQVSLERVNEALVVHEEHRAKYFQEAVHDLKAPLATITTYAELTRSGIAQKAGKQQQYLQEIEGHAKELATRIQKLRKLDYRELENLECHPVESLTYLRTVADKYEILAAKKGIALKVDGESFVLAIDEEKMGIALENLIMNSIRFTAANGSITLLAEIKEGCKQFVVWDTGAGVNALYLNTIFDRGLSFTEDEEERTQHSGLGLHIVKQIAGAHNGTITVESQEGKGSRFILRFQ